MAHINRRYIDKHWLVFIFRGALALLFGWFVLFGTVMELSSVVSLSSVFLLLIGIIDSLSALYSASKKHGWVNSIVDAGIDIIAALILLFLSNASDIVFQLVVIASYTIISGIIDILHGFLSTVDPTDRFIRVLTGICGCIMGFVILNVGDFETTTFIRLFGVYMIIVGITSLIYGVHNRSQEIEDKIARKESAKARSIKKTNAKKSTKKAK